MHGHRIKNLIPLIILAALALIIYVLEFSNHFTFEILKQKEKILFAWVSANPLLSAFTLFFVYIFSICLFIPDATILTFFAGMVYPLPYAVMLSTLAETFGALLFFIIVRFSFFSTNIKRKKKFLHKAGENFHRHPASYLLFLRFSHVIPSWLINSVSAFFKAPIWTFAWTTFLGTVPISYLAAEAGRKVHSLGVKAHPVRWDDFLDTETKLLLISLSCLALLPILIKRLFTR